MVLRLIWEALPIAGICCLAACGCTGIKVESSTAEMTSHVPEGLVGHADSVELQADSPVKGRMALPRLHELRGQTMQAQRLYRELIQEETENPLPYHRLGVIAAKQGKFAEADEYFQAARELGPPSPGLLSDIGYALYLRSRLEEAEQVLREALQLQPDHPAACNNLGLVLGMQGRYRESLAMFKRATDEAEAYANLAYVHAQRGELAEAQAGYLHALTLNKDLRAAAKALLELRERSRLQLMVASDDQASPVDEGTDAESKGAITHDQRASESRRAVERGTRPSNELSQQRSGDPLGSNMVRTVEYNRPVRRPPEEESVRPMASSVTPDGAPTQLPPLPHAPQLKQPGDLPDRTEEGQATRKAFDDRNHRSADGSDGSGGATHSSPPKPYSTGSSLMTNEQYPTARPTWAP